MLGAYANLDGLVRLSQRQGIDIRRPLLRVLTDLYVQERHHTREQEQQFVELAMRLLPDIDAATRSSIARKLIAYGQAPKAVLDLLSGIDPEIKALMSAGAPQEDIAPQIALPETTVHIADTAPADTETPLAVVSAALADAGEPHTLGEEFLRASAVRRVEMLQSTSETGETATFLIPGRAIAAGRFEAAALRRNQEGLVRELRQALSISNRTAWRIVQDESGEPLLIAAKALGMSIDVLIRVMLFINPSIGESVERVFSLAATYERMAENAGTAILQSWREEAASRPQVRFQSVASADGAADTRTGARDHGEQPAADRVGGKVVNE